MHIKWNDNQSNDIMKLKALRAIAEQLSELVIEVRTLNMIQNK